MKNWFFLVPILLVFSISTIPSGSAIPVIDGQYSDTEWQAANSYDVELNDGRFIELFIAYSTTTMYFLALVPDDDIQLDVNNPHDYFGIEFDNNNDEAIMGTEKSPDDTILVNYETSGAADMFMHSFSAFYDTDFQGTENTEGSIGIDGSIIVFEFSKPLRSDDDAGNDISLSSGDEFQIMLAFWDNQPAHSANAIINKRIDNFQFLSLSVGVSLQNTSAEIIAFSTIAVSVALAVFVNKLTQ